MAGIDFSSAYSPSRAGITLRELLLWLFSAAVLVIVVRYFHIGNPALFWAYLNRLNVFAAGALCVAGWRLRQFRSGRPASGRDVAIAGLLLGLLVLMGLLPRMTGLGLYLFAFAIYLASLDDRTRELRASAVVLLALATNFLFAPLIFRLFLPFFVWLDSILVGHALQFVDSAVEWRGTRFVQHEGARKFGITLVGACSSFNNVSAAVLVHVAWAMALRKHLTRLDALALLCTISIATLLNVTRVVLTALGPENYAFWHGDGTSTAVGGWIFLALQNCLLVLAGYLTARWAGRGKA
jgi:hypothetical protein